MTTADVVCGLAWGDEAKGKVTAQLAQERNYDLVARYSGGPNAGHTIVVNNVTYKTRLVPAGIFYDIPCLIGPDCVVNPALLMEELAMLDAAGFDTDLVKIHPGAHIICPDHIVTDSAGHLKNRGSTGNGIAPCYAAKAARTGRRAVTAFKPTRLWTGPLPEYILCEGAQGVRLDINSPSYPYCTSSVCWPYNACSLGLAPQDINEIWGCAKLYDTRVGADPYFRPQWASLSTADKAALEALATVGQEVGTVTGRTRKTNFLDLTKLIQAINQSGTTHIVISKCDIVEQVGAYKTIENDELVAFSSLQEMKNHVALSIIEECPVVEVIHYSDNPQNFTKTTQTL